MMEKGGSDHRLPLSRAVTRRDPLTLQKDVAACSNDAASTTQATSSTAVITGESEEHRGLTVTAAHRPSHNGKSHGREDQAKAVPTYWKSADVEPGIMTTVTRLLEAQQQMIIWNLKCKLWQPKVSHPSADSAERTLTLTKPVWIGGKNSWRRVAG